MAKLFLFVLTILLADTALNGQSGDLVLRKATLTDHLSKDFTWIKNRYQIDSSHEKEFNRIEILFVLSGKVLSDTVDQLDGFGVSEIYYHFDSTGKTDAWCLRIPANGKSFINVLKTHYGEPSMTLRFSAGSLEVPETNNMSWQVGPLHLFVTDAMWENGDLIVAVTNGSKTYLRATQNQRR